MSAEKSGYYPQPKIEIAGQELVAYTREALFADNQSIESRSQRREWQEAEEAGKTLIVDTCSDFRMGRLFTLLYHHPHLRIIRSVAAATPIEYLGYLITNTPDQVVVAPHFSLKVTEPGKRPLTCGGASALAALLQRRLPKEAKRIVEYLRNIVSHDVVIQSIARASQIAELDSKKTVLSTIVDHDTGFMIPLGVICEGGTSLKLSQAIHKFNDPRELYKEGKPYHLMNKYIPSEFRDLIDYHNRRLDNRVKRHPELIEEQKIQNPKMIILTTSIIPEGDRYPQHGAAFTVTIPFIKEEGVMTEIVPRALDTAFAQLWYAVYHSTEALPGQSFFDTKTLLIETKNIKHSREAADKLVKQEREWVLPWINKGGKILIAEVVTIEEEGKKLPGQTTIIEEYKMAA